MNKALHIIIYIATALVALSARGGAAQAFNPAEAEVSLVTFYPGSEIYELEGHSALRVRGSGRDVAVSYGTFDFEAPNFVYRYVKGETDYWVSVMPWPMFVYPYVTQERRIVEHSINMTPEQKRRLFELIDENLKPENKVYRYNYVRDNCATRPLGIVERALGDSIVLATPGEGSQAQGETFRSVMRRYHANYPWYQFGIDLALGSGIDVAIDNREKAFAPVVLDTQLKGATVGGRPLVGESRVLNDLPADNAVLEATPWFLSPMFVCWVAFVLTMAVCVFDVRRRKASSWLYAAWAVVFGMAGLLIWFLVFISTHEATSPNYLMVWLNPFWIPAAALMWSPKTRRVAIYVFAAEALATFLLMLLWPLTPQVSNAAFWPLMGCAVIAPAIYVVLNTPSLSEKFLKKY